MAILMVVTLVLIIAAVGLFWPEPDAATGDDAGQAAAEAGSTPTTLEGALVAQLMSGAISHAQYRKAVARIAERDDARNPMTVPDNGRPDACA